MKHLKILFFLLFFILNIFLFSDNSLAAIGSCKCSRSGMISPTDCYTGQTDQAACNVILKSKTSQNYIMCTYETDDDCFGSWKNSKDGQLITTTCGSNTCEAGQICIGGSICYANTNESCTKNEDCSKYGGGALTGATSGKDYICKDKECYVSGIALTKYNEQKDDWIKIYNEIKPPNPAIKIPGLDFSSVSTTVDSEGYIHIPYLGQYLTAVYKFAMVAISIVAVVMLIVIGAGAIVSGGGEKKVEGYKKIGKVFLGLAIAWGSYAILYNINPDLVEFKMLKVKYVKPEKMPEFIDKGEPGVASCNNKKPKSDTTYDKYFKKHGSNKEVDWRVLKAMAFKESGLDAECVNSIGFTGLFQFKPSICRSTIGKSNKKCNELKNPDYNTEAGAVMLKSNINSIKKYCPKASGELLYTLVYMSHNSGIGAVKCATKTTCSMATNVEACKKSQSSKECKSTITTNGACSLKGVELGITNYWKNHWKTKAGYKGADAGRGKRTYDYSLSVGKLIQEFINKYPAN